MKKIFFKFIILLLFLSANFCIAQDILLDAMQSELQRSIEGLSMTGQEKPFFISYTASDYKRIDVSASFGGIISSQETRSRIGLADIRVGDYSFDNSNFSGSPMGIFNSRIQYPIEDDPYAIKYEIWLATDKSYKNAIDELARKKSAIQNKNNTDKINSFSREQAQVLIENKSDLSLKKDEYEKKALEYSNVFKNFSGIAGSNVDFCVEVSNEYLVNSEGTKIRKPSASFDIEISAMAIDNKGNRFYDHVTFYGMDLKDLPTNEIIVESINKMAGQLIEVMKSPTADDYSGPVLITAEASPNFFNQILSKSLSGKPAPVSSSTSNSQPSNSLLRKIGKKILPDFISIYDDPATNNYKGINLVGGFKVDDEGVMSQKVKIVENGILKNLLMSRIPNNKFENSNGHARGEIMKRAEPRTSNVFISSSIPKSYEDLKKELINTCKEQDLEYGIIIKKITDPLVISAGIESFSSTLPSSRSNEISVSLPTLTYKIYAKDGREELVRGLSFGNLNLKVLKDILSAGNDLSVFNYRSRGNSGDILSSFISPSIIIDDFELNAEKDQNKKPPILKNPYFSQK